MTTKPRKRRILDELHETACGLHKFGLISAHRMAEYDAMSKGSAEDMVPTRAREHPLYIDGMGFRSDTTSSGNFRSGYRRH